MFLNHGIHQGHLQNFIKYIFQDSPGGFDSVAIWCGSGWCNFSILHRQFCCAVRVVVKSTSSDSDALVWDLTPVTGIVVVGKLISLHLIFFIGKVRVIADLRCANEEKIENTCAEWSPVSPSNLCFALLCPERLVYSTFIKGLPCLSASGWVQPVRGQRWSGECGYLFPHPHPVPSLMIYHELAVSVAVFSASLRWPPRTTAVFSGSQEMPSPLVPSSKVVKGFLAVVITGVLHHPLTLLTSLQILSSL